MASLSVPGNLLLMGEYAVLEERGAGICFAVEPRVIVDWSPAPELSIIGCWGGETEEWRAHSNARSSTAGTKVSAGLIGRIVDACGKELAEAGRGQLPAVRIVADSTAFFRSGGRKSGLGSSAAVSVGIAAALFEGAGIKRTDLPGPVFRAAIAAHRAYQNGRGSGYDIAASLHGGVGLFSGGALPEVRPISLPWLPLFQLRHPASSVRTADAIGRYIAWKTRNPDSAAQWIERSNETVRAFAASSSWSEGVRLLRVAASLGVWLGREIGVSAEVEAPAGAQVAKALGAGNEIAGLWLDEGSSPPSGSEAARISKEGILWSA